MKLAPQIRVLLMSLLLAPATVLLGVFLMAISAHSGGILTALGMCLAPGMLLLYFAPGTHDEIQIGIAGQFVLFMVLGQLHLQYGERWRRWWQGKQDKWLGEKWERWFNQK